MKSQQTKGTERGGGGGGTPTYFFGHQKKLEEHLIYIIGRGTVRPHDRPMWWKVQNKKGGGGGGIAEGTKPYIWKKKSKQNRSSHENDSLFSPFYNRLWGSSKIPGGAAPPAPPAPRGLHLCICYTASFLCDYFADMLDHRGGSRILI